MMPIAKDRRNNIEYFRTKLDGNTVIMGMSGGLQHTVTDRKLEDAMPRIEAAIRYKQEAQVFTLGDNPSMVERMVKYGNNS